MKNGKLNSADQLVLQDGGNMVKRSRYILHADTLYTLVCFAPATIVADEQHSAFFDQFIIKDDGKASSVLKNKAGELIKALSGKDSTNAVNARNIIDKVSFTKEELPLLYNAMLSQYPDDSMTYSSTRSKLIDVIEELADSSTVDFIRQHYDDLADRGSDQLALLNILVNYKTVYSYNTLKDLFTKKPPQHIKERKSIGYNVTDSLELTRLLFRIFWFY